MAIGGEFKGCVSCPQQPSHEGQGSTRCVVAKRTSDENKMRGRIDSTDSRFQDARCRDFGLDEKIPKSQSFQLK